MLVRWVAAGVVAGAIAVAVWGNIEKHAPVAAVETAAVGSSTPPAKSAPKDTYPVAKVVDGDTIDIVMSGKSVRVRLIGLDTPEIVDPRKPVQCFAKEASDKAKEILVGQSVRIEGDPSQDRYDKYGRLLAYVYLPDGTLFNKYMIAEGYGHEYTYHLPYKHQAEFKAAEKKAREEKKGLWTDGICTSTRKSGA